MKHFDDNKSNGVADSVEPTPEAHSSNPNKYPTCDSILYMEYIHDVTLEVINAVEGAGLTLDGADRFQLFEAIQNIAEDFADVAEAAAIAAIPAFSEIRIPQQGTPNGTALAAGATKIATTTLTLPANREWVWLKVVFMTKLDGGSKSMQFSKIEVDGNVQSFVSVDVDIEFANTDDQTQIHTTHEGVPSVIDQDITIDYFAKLGTFATGDNTGARKMYVVGIHRAE